jgi:hypothetical protein
VLSVTRWRKTWLPARGTPDPRGALAAAIGRPGEQAAQWDRIGERTDPADAHVSHRGLPCPLGAPFELQGPIPRASAIAENCVRMLASATANSLPTTQACLEVRIALNSHSGTEAVVSNVHTRASASGGRMISAATNSPRFGWLATHGDCHKAPHWRSRHRYEA